MPSLEDDVDLEVDDKDDNVRKNQLYSKKLYSTLQQMAKEKGMSVPKFIRYELQKLADIWTESKTITPLPIVHNAPNERSAGSRWRKWKK